MSFHVRTHFWRAVASVAVLAGMRAQFLPTAPGTYKFDDVATNTANWTAGTPTGVFSQNLSGAQTVTFANDTSLSSGLTFDLPGPSPLTLASDGDGARTLTLGGDVSMAGVTSSIVTIGSLTGTSALNLSFGAVSRTLDISAGNSLVLVNNVSGSGALMKAGAGTLVITGSGSYTGGTNVTGGVFQLGDGLTDGTVSGNIAVGSGASLLFIPHSNTRFSGVISGAGSVTKDEAGGNVAALTLDGDNTYSGGTTVAKGTLTVANPTGSGTGTGTVTVNSGAVLQIGDHVTANAGAVSGAITNNGTVYFNRPGTLTQASVISGDGAVSVVTGTATLTAANSYTGGTTVGTGAVLELGDTTGQTLVPGADVTLNGTGELQVSQNQTIRGLISSSATSSVVLAGGKALTINLPNAGADPVHSSAEFAGVMSGAGTLVMGGPGSFTLSGTNTYLGGTSFNTGLLVVGSDANLGDAAGGLTFNGGTLQASAGFTSARGITLNPGGGTIDTHTYSLTFSGVVTGTGGLTVQSQVGNGVLTLTNSANQYAGATFINSGTLKVGAANALPTDNQITVASGAALEVSANQTLAGLTGAGTVSVASGKTLTTSLSVASTFDGTWSGTGALTKSGASTLTLTGDSASFTGPVSVTAGTLRFGNGGTSGGIAADIAVSSGATLEFNRTDATPVTFANTVSGAGTFSKIGSATLVLGSANAFNGFTGTATIGGGTLRVDADVVASAAAVSVTSAGTFAIGSAVPNGVTVGTLTGLGGTTVATGKTLTIAGAAASTYNGAISGGGSLERTGAGTLTLAGNNSYLGDTWITAGAIGDGMSGAYSSGSAMRVNNGATLKVDFIETIPGLKDYSAGVSGTVQIGNSATLTIDNAAANTFTGTLAGAGSLSKTSAGELIFAGTSTYNGTVNLNAGTLTVGATNAFTADSVAVNNSAVFNVANSTGVGGLSGAGTTTVGAGQTLTVKKQALFTTVVGGPGGVTFANSNSVNGLTSLTASQTYTGATTVSIGSLQLGNATAPVSVAGPIVLGSGTTLVFSHGSSNSTHSQSISGGGSLAKNNSGTLTLTGSNSYTGSTTVTGGTLKAAAANALPAGTGLSLSSGVLLDVAASQTINRFLTTDATSSILLEAGQLLTVTLGSNPGAGTQFNGTITGAGGLRIGDAGNSGVILTGDNNYSGGTTIDAQSVLQLGVNTTTGMITGNVLNNGVLTFARTNSVVFNGVISGSGVVKQVVGSGTLEFTAANTYGGNTFVYGGKLLAMNASGSATGSGSVAVYTGGLFGGSGTISGPLAVNSGGTVAPGADLGTPATLHAGSTTFEGGATFAFQIKDATGSAGSGYSLLSSSGSLTVNATAGNPFTVSVYSVNGTSQGLTTNFDPTQAYSWTFVSAASVITDFNAAAFQVNTANFQNAFTGSFGVGLSQSGFNLLLNYTPAAVPEPATWALLAAGLGAVFWWRRRGAAGRRAR